MAWITSRSVTSDGGPFSFCKPSYPDIRLRKIPFYSEGYGSGGCWLTIAACLFFNDDFGDIGRDWMRYRRLETAPRRA